MDPYNVFQRDLNDQLITLAELNDKFNKSLAEMVLANKDLGVFPEPLVYATTTASKRKQIQEQHLQASLVLDSQAKRQIRKLKDFQADVAEIIRKTYVLHSGFNCHNDELRRHDRIPSRFLASDLTSSSPSSLLSSSPFLSSSTATATAENILKRARSTEDTTLKTINGPFSKFKSHRTRTLPHSSLSGIDTEMSSTKGGVAALREGKGEQHSGPSLKILPKVWTVPQDWPPLSANHPAMVLDRFLNVENLLEDVSQPLIDRHTDIQNKMDKMKLFYHQIENSGAHWVLNEVDQERIQTYELETERLITQLMMVFYPTSGDPFPFAVHAIGENGGGAFMPLSLPPPPSPPKCKSVFELSFPERMMMEQERPIILEMLYSLFVALASIAELFHGLRILWVAN